MRWMELLCEMIRQHWNRSAEAIKQAVIDDVTRFIGEQKVYDDLTLVVLKILPCCRSLQECQSSVWRLH